VDLNEAEAQKEMDTDVNADMGVNINVGQGVKFHRSEVVALWHLQNTRPHMAAPAPAAAVLTAAVAPGSHISGPVLPTNPF